MTSRPSTNLGAAAYPIALEVCFGSNTGMREVTFSIHAYIAAAVSGSVAMALFVYIGNGLNVAGPGIALILLFAIFYSLPAMLLMMPATFLGIHLANRFGWRGKRHFFTFAAAATLLTTAALLPFARKVSLSFNGPEELGAFIRVVASLGLSGGIAGLIYRAAMIGSRPGTTTLL